MTLSSFDAAIANAFFYRCCGIPDLALSYLKESYRLVPLAAGKAPLGTPARGPIDRFHDWLDAGREAGLESEGHMALRRACVQTPLTPAPFQGVDAIMPATAGDDPIRAASTVSSIALDAHSRHDTDLAIAADNYNLLINPTNILALYNLGIALIEKELWDESTHRFEILLSLEPTHRFALLAMHNIALTRNRMAGLAPHLEKLITIREAPAPKGIVPEVMGPAPMAPIITLSTEDAEAAADLILQRGAGQIQGATRPEACTTLRDLAQEWFAADERRLSWPVLRDLPQYQDPLQLVTPDLLMVLHRVFGRPPEISITDTYLRRVKPQSETSYIPFHQDITALAITGINVWIPLMACGEDSPSLEIMAQRTTRVFPTVTSAGDYNQTEISAETVYAEFPPALRFYPRPALGDAVLFLGSTVHRSHIAPGMTKERLSLEMRFY